MVARDFRSRSCRRARFCSRRCVLCGACPAGVGATCVVVRPRVVDVVCLDGRIGVAGLARAGILGRSCCAAAFHRSTGRKRTLDMVVLCVATGCARIRRDPAVVGHDRSDNSAVLARQ